MNRKPRLSLEIKERDAMDTSSNGNARAVKSRMRMEIKDLTDQGTFEGLLSPYGNVDHGNDVVEPGAYTKTLKDQGNTRVLLWQHHSDRPIGSITLEDRPDGLWAKAKLLLELPDAKNAYLLMKAGIVKGLSIGFETVKDSIQDGVRHLKEIRLWEGSVVTFQMNPLAVVTSVKAADAGNGDEAGDFYEELEEIQTLATFYQMEHALWNALCEVIYADMTRDDKITAQQNICAQFAGAMNEFFPQYLDRLVETYGEMEQWRAKRILETKAAAKTKRVAGEDLPASAFAYVGDKTDTSTWKLPIKFSSDEKTKRHIRNALARFGQTQGIPESERAGVLAKIKAAAKKAGIEVSDDNDKTAVVILEQKLGARFSAESKSAIQEICGNLQDVYDNLYDAHDHLQALIDGGADDKSTITPLETAARRKSEPANDHSAAQSLIAEIGSLIPSA